MGNSLLAVVSTCRPGQDSVSANAELVRWTGIRPWPSPWSTRTRSHRSRCIAGSRRSCRLWRVSGHAAPRVVRGRDDPLHTLSDRDLTEELRSMGGTPHEILSNQDLLATILPTLRTDFELIENWVPDLPFLRSEEATTVRRTRRRLKRGAMRQRGHSKACNCQATISISRAAAGC